MSLAHEPLVIIGAGPAALTAAIYASRAGGHPVVYTGTEQPGGDLTTTTSVDNFPGFPAGIQGPALVEAMQVQAERFGARIVFDDVTALDVARQRLTLATGVEVQYDAAILTTGSQHRKLGVPNEDELTGSGVSYCATCDAFFFQGDKVAVIGGGDSAMEEALFLAKYAEHVTILVRGDSLRASQAMVDRVKSTPNISIRFGITPLWFVDEGGQLTGIVVEDRGNDHPETVHVTGAFVAIGSDPRTDLVAGQVPLTEHGTIAVRGRTSRVSDAGYTVPGLFAAGDVIDHRYRQAITAAGSGAAAGIDAIEYLDALNAHLYGPTPRTWLA